MAVAANCARKTLQLASASTRTLLSRPSSPASASYAAKFNGLASSSKPASASRVSPQKRSLSFSWLPEQLAGAQVSLTPLHSVTASALFTSLLSLHNNKWGCLSEGSSGFLLFCSCFFGSFVLCNCKQYWSCLSVEC